jgi:hypothetical protein
MGRRRQQVDGKRKGADDKEVLVDPSNLDKKLQISTDFDPKEELMLITFLWNNLDVFAWQISDLPEIPREVTEPKLGIDPSYKPVKQKERTYTPERCKTIWQEVNKLLEARFIRPVDYPNCLANPVLVEKPDAS